MTVSGPHCSGLRRAIAWVQVRLDLVELVPLPYKKGHRCRDDFVVEETCAKRPLRWVGRTEEKKGFVLEALEQSASEGGGDRGSIERGQDQVGAILAEVTHGHE